MTVYPILLIILGVAGALTLFVAALVALALRQPAVRPAAVALRRPSQHSDGEHGRQRAL